MDPKLLSELGWKTLVVKFKIKDTALQKQLAAFQKIDEDKYDERLKAVALVAKLAGDLKKSKEITSLGDVVKYLTNVFNTANQAQNEIKQDKVLAEKAEKAVANATAKAKVKEEAEGDEDEDENADSFVKLATAIKSIRNAKIPYYALICIAKPYGLVMSKKDISMSMNHKRELAAIAGGSTRPPMLARCWFENSKLVFEMEKPPTGLAGILKKWIKLNVNLDVKVMVGMESDEDEEKPGAKPPGTDEKESEGAEAEEVAKVAAGGLPLTEAPDAWLQTRRDIGSNIDKLKSAIRKEFASEGPKLVAEIDKNLQKLDGVLGKLDDKLAGAIAKANEAKDKAGREAAIKACRTMLASYVSFVSSEKLIDHIDSNPFGVKTGIRATLTDTLEKLSKTLA